MFRIYEITYSHLNYGIERKLQRTPRKSRKVIRTHDRAIAMHLFSQLVSNRALWRGPPREFSLPLFPCSPRQISELPLFPSTPGRPSTPLGRANAAQSYGYGFESVQAWIFSSSSATAEVAELTALIFTTFIPWSCKRGRISFRGLAER